MAVIPLVHRSTSKLKLLLAGWLLVASWFAATPGVMPMLFATAAWMDGEHGVQIGGAGDEVSVVLTHGEENAGRVHEQIHHHRLLGRMLTSCTISTGGQPDHVMLFATATSAKEERQSVVPRGAQPVATVPALPQTFILIPLPKSEDAPRRRVALWPPGSIPDIPGLRPALLI